MTKHAATLPLPAPSQRAVEDTYYRAQRRRDKGAFLSIAFVVPAIIINFVVDAMARAQGTPPHWGWLTTSYLLGALGILIFLLTFRSTAPFRTVNDRLQKEAEALCAKSELGRKYRDSVRAQGRTRFVRCEVAEIKKVLARR